MSFNFVKYMGRHWLWPEDDKALRAVVDWASDVYVAMNHVKTKGVAVQAGGAMGVWPYILAQTFEKVFTFEPHPTNFHCLRANLQDIENVTAFNAALGEHCGYGEIRLPKEEQGNFGAFYVVPGDGGDTVTLALDSCENIDRVDFLCLDVEGCELPALRGAEKLIRAHRPVIMLEEKKLPQLGNDLPYGEKEAAKWLKQEFGYRPVARPHRDLVLVPWV